MDSVGVQVAVLLLIVLGVLVIGDQVLGARRGDRADGSGSAVLAWLGLTVITLWCGAMVAFVMVNVLYFALGAPAGAGGMAVTAVFLVATPIVWAVVIRRRRRHVPAKR